LSEIVILVAVVSVFSIIQSAFGVGLLLFGTPTLLMIGYPYDLVLWYLLPSSIAISFIQTVGHRDLIKNVSYVFYYTLPMLIISLSIILTYDELIDIKSIVGIMLIILGMARISNSHYYKIKLLVSNNLKFSHWVMGLVHGVSNMGGAVLAFLMISCHSDKYCIRTNISFVYMIFGVSQLGVLSFISNHKFNLNNLFLVIVAIFVYLAAGRFLTGMMSNKKYETVITMLILIYGVGIFV